MINDTGYTIWEIRSHLQEDLIDLRLWTGDDQLGHFFMIRPKESFEGMGIGTMSNVMKKSSCHGQ